MGVIDCDICSKEITNPHEVNFQMQTNQFICSTCLSLHKRGKIKIFVKKGKFEKQALKDGE